MKKPMLRFIPTGNRFADKTDPVLVRAGQVRVPPTREELAWLRLRIILN